MKSWKVYMEKKIRGHLVYFADTSVLQTGSWFSAQELPLTWICKTFSITDIHEARE